MNKHKFNVFPEAKEEDFARLLDDIKENGYDRTQPIILYQNAILDGWNRWAACKKLGITPPTSEFKGDEDDAIAFVMRTNKRRNLSSGQWAAIAVEARDIIEAIANSQDKGGRPKKDDEKPEKKFSPVSKDERSTTHKTAELFNTNKTYVTQAAKIKQAAPRVFEQVKSGKMTMQDAARVVRAIPTEPWMDDEKQRKEQAEKGKTVIANANRDKNLIQWAEKHGLAVRIDRTSEFGNPFLLGQDGTRDEVCDNYRDHYLPFKPSLKSKLKALKGKVLICHCYPDRCHGESLVS